MDAILEAIEAQLVEDNREIDQLEAARAALVGQPVSMSERIAALSRQGEKPKDIAALTGCHIQYVYNIRRKLASSVAA